MKCNIKEYEDGIIIDNLKDFNPVHIFDCGQCFRWNREEDRSYTGVAFGKVLNVKEEEGRIIFTNTNMEDFNNVWFDYFDLERDYGEIKDVLSEDPILREGIKFGEGIRILNQDPFETLISFIISANNAIPRIKRSIELISQRYGKYIEEFRGKKYFAFPSPAELSVATVEELKECKVGFRGKYILDGTDNILNRQIDLDEIKSLPTENVKEKLMKIKGIGDKVSSCIALFSMRKGDAFPIDVWVKRVMEYFYLRKDTKPKEILSFADNKFGRYKGFAQQYLFYYARELGIGKEKKQNNRK